MPSHKKNRNRAFLQHVRCLEHKIEVNHRKDILESWFEKSWLKKDEWQTNCYKIIKMMTAL